MTSTKCSECGAAARTEEDRFCAYCGARFPEPAAPPVVSAADGRQAHLEVLLGRREVQAELGRQVSTAPLATRQGLGLIPIGFAALTIFTSGITWMLFYVMTVCNITA